LACALMVRGPDVEMSDIRRNIDRYKQLSNNLDNFCLRIRSHLKFAHWNQEGWKVGHCLAAPLHQKQSLLTLSNNSCITTIFDNIYQRFKKLYKFKVRPINSYLILFFVLLFKPAANCSGTSSSLHRVHKRRSFFVPGSRGAS
jgi:hypothetical protein